MESNQSNLPTEQPQRPARKGWSPLAIVLILSAGFFAIFLAVSGVMYMQKSPGAKSASSGTTALFGNGSVGVIELNGVIMDSRKILKKLDNFEEDSDIKAVV